MIVLKNITKEYESIIALKDINLKIDSGDLVVLKGVSGSGKSTILSLIAGINRPTVGEVIVDNKRVSKLQDRFASLYRRESIGFIFQRYNLIPNLTVRDNILTPLIPINLREDEINKRLDRVLKQFNIIEKRDIVVKNLSGGEQQRVAIARALINNPKIIIADEPTANLDEKLSLSFIDIIKNLKDRKKTIIIATHDPLFFNLDIIDRLVEIRNGKIL